MTDLTDLPDYDRRVLERLRNTNAADGLSGSADPAWQKAAERLVAAGFAVKVGDVYVAREFATALAARDAPG